MNLVRIATWNEVPDGMPTAAATEGVDLVIVRRGDTHSVLYGRCLHRGALLADGKIQGDDLICGLHGWDYRIESEVSAYNNAEALERFTSVVQDDGLFVDRDEVIRWKLHHPQPYSPDVYQGLYTDPHGAIEEPYVMRIHELAEHGLEKVGHHGFVAAMGVPRQELPTWDAIQFVTAELARLPLLDTVPVDTEVCIGPNARQPLFLDIPLFVSDMSFGALSQEAKTALARGAQLAGTGICSGEGGMLPEEQAENSRYFYELASARFGWTWNVVKKVQAFHFKLGQGAKTGTGSHLPGPKVVGRIAEMRGLPEGTPAVSPPTFPDWKGVDDFRRFADEVRERSGGIPIGAKLSAQHIEADLDAALGQYLAELNTAVKYDIPITHVLLNNAQLGKISKEQRAAEWDVWQTSLHNPDFSEYARVCGAHGTRVTEARQLDDALAAAFAHDGPALVEVMTDADLV